MLGALIVLTGFDSYFLAVYLRLSQAYFTSTIVSPYDFSQA
jgi:hypothetical protein